MYIIFAYIYVITAMSLVETPERSSMLGAIIGDMAGSIYEFNNIKSRELSSYQNDVSLQMIRF